MLNALLSIIPKGDGNFYFSNKAEALIYALMGFVVVAIGIVLIIFIIWLIGLILRKTDNLAFLTKRKTKSKKKKIEETVAEAVTEDDVPDEVKAAIIAAVMAYYSEEKPRCEFRVKRIKRI